MSPATPNAIRHAHGPTSAIGSRITDSAYPAPAASASIDAANARAPSGASSITAMPPTMSAAFTQARTRVCAAVKITKFGAIALSPLAMHTPRTAPRRILRRPTAVGEARGHERDQRTEARDRERAAELTVRRVERLRDGIAQLAEQRGGERGDRAGERDGRDQLRLRLVEGARRGERMGTERLGCLGTARPRRAAPGAPTSARAGSRSGRRGRRTNRRTGSSCRSRRRARRRSRRRCPPG